MVSVPNRGSGASSSRRLSSTSPWTYRARMILNTLRRESINTAREAVHGAKIPSRRNPESRKTLGIKVGVPSAIKTPEATPAHFRQVLQSLTYRHPAASQRVLDTLTKAKKANVRGHNHECLAKLNEQDFSPLPKLVLSAVLRRNRNAAHLTDSDSFNWTSRPCCHNARF